MTDQIMTEQVEVSSLDLRYQGYRLRNRHDEKRLLASVLENGIREPLQGVNTESGRILLNGFKRYRCAKKIGLAIVPYFSLANDEAVGILAFLRMANSKSLTILEQAKLIDELQAVHGLGNAEIAGVLEKSKAWVSMRAGMIGLMTPTIIEKIMSGDFPARSYLYTLRQFTRVNTLRKEEVEAFVRSVAGKGLSTRDIDRLAHGYFKGSLALRQQITAGNAAWALSQLKQSSVATPQCSQAELSMLQDLDTVQKTMCQIIAKSQHNHYQSTSFYVQANVLMSGILNQVDSFSKAVKDFYDRSRQAQSDLPPASGGHGVPRDYAAVKREQEHRQDYHCTTRSDA